MTTDSSTYTYKSGEQETVTLRRGTADPHGHALLRIKHDDGKTLDCYVNTAWLRDQLDNLDPRPLTPDAITDEMVERAFNLADRIEAVVINKTIMRDALTAALTEPPARPEGAEDIEALVLDYKRENAHRGYSEAEIADYVAARLTDPTRKEA